MVLLWSALATRPRGADDAARCGRCRRCRRARAGSPTCAATTTSAGRSPTPTRPPRGEDAYLHRRFLGRLLRRASSRARSPAARASSPTRNRRGAHQRHLRVARRPRAAPDESPSSSASGACCCCYAVAFAHGGLPLIYMGDELGLLNDAAWRDDPHRADDNRWMHRPPMDWDAAARRHDPATVEGRLWAGLQRADRACAPPRAPSTPRARASRSGRATTTSSACAARTRARRLLLLANFSRRPADGLR